MKKYSAFSIVTLFITLMFNNCKKETATAPKDYSISIKDKTWWGTLTNAGETPQYYGVHFNANNTLTWSQFSGDYTGKWLVDKNKLTLTFTSPAVIITADISDDNKLANITTNTPDKVNSGQITDDPNIALDNTVWRGSFKNGQTLQLTFFPNSKFERLIPTSTYTSGTTTYTRSATGCIRSNLFDKVLFCVIVSGSEMNGCNANATNLWNATKQ